MLKIWCVAVQTIESHLTGLQEYVAGDSVSPRLACLDLYLGCILPVLVRVLPMLRAQSREIEEGAYCREGPR